jgi:5-methylcytosine-specific restriction endonuclease McrA
MSYTLLEARKVCSRCALVKPLTDYGRQASNPDGHKYECRDCQKARDKGYSATNSAQRVATATQWKKDNPARAQATGARYRQKLRDLGIKRPGNLDAGRIGYQNFRARQAGTEEKLLVSDVELVRSVFAYCCVACAATDDLTLDHVVPLSVGGRNHPINLQLLCRGCNVRKRQQDTDYRTNEQLETLYRKLVAAQRLDEL